MATFVRLTRRLGRGTARGVLFVLVWMFAGSGVLSIVLTPVDWWHDLDRHSASADVEVQQWNSSTESIPPAEVTNPRLRPNGLGTGVDLPIDNPAPASLVLNHASATAVRLEDADHLVDGVGGGLLSLVFARLLFDLREGRPFSRRNTWLTVLAAVLVFATLFGSSLMRRLAATTIIREAHLAGTGLVLAPELDWVRAARWSVLLLLLAGAFQFGARLRDDVDGLV